MNIFYDAPCLVVICAKAHTPFAAADCRLAAQNLMLQAYTMGPGTGVIGSAVTGLNAPATKQELDILAETVAIAPIIVGRPRGETPRSARSEPHVLAWR